MMRQNLLATLRTHNSGLLSRIWRHFGNRRAQRRIRWTETELRELPDTLRRDMGLDT